QSLCSGPVCERLLERLAITYRMGERDLENVPKSGACIVVANHPFGILEGAVLATVLKRVRPDVRFLGNQLLQAIPEVQDLLIPVNVGGSSNVSGVRAAIDFLQRGGCLVVFPAGEVSRLNWRQGGVTDPQWHTAVARMVDALSKRNVAASIVPVYVQ